MNCPFYGRHMYIQGIRGQGHPFLLVEQKGNQCGLIVNSYSPCWMEQNGEPIDWKACPLVNDVRLNVGQ